MHLNVIPTHPPVSNPNKLTESPSLAWVGFFLWFDFGSLNRPVLCLREKGHYTTTSSFLFFRAGEHESRLGWGLYWGSEAEPQAKALLGTE